MTSVLGEAFEALLSTGAALTRGWPQALMPLPSIALTETDNSLGTNGEEAQTLELVLRCASPEAADALALAVDSALSGLGLRRSACRDGAEKDKAGFLKTLRYERRTAAPGLLQQTISLTVGEAVYQAQVILWERERLVHDTGSLDDGFPRLRAGHFIKARLRLRLAGDAFDALRAACEAGTPVTLTQGSSESCALVAGYSLKAGALEAELFETL